MEYQKIMNLLDNKPNQRTKFSTKNWVRINDNSSGTYNTNSQIKFKTPMLGSSLCDYGDVYVIMVISGTITTTGAGDDDAVRLLDKRNKGIVFKNCAPFTDCISEINR